MIEWIEVTDSARVVAVAYDREAEAILVRFPTGVEWRYDGCPPHEWDAFTAPGVSKGRYIHEVLNHRRNGPHC